MTDTTDIKALRPSERAKLGFVTDDNTGGYYVAECEECGQIFPSQTCNGGEQIADSGDYGDCYCPHCGFIDPLECDNANLVWNVQQLKIVNLTKQLEAERQRADKVEAKYTEVSGWYVKMKTRMLKAEAELAALKGSVGEAKDWEIDHSTDVPILVYKKCSVIESDQAYGLLNLIKQSELKGDHVPVAYLIHEKAKPARLSFQNLKGYVSQSDIEEHELWQEALFTAPQKPVVLPEAFYPDGDTCNGQLKPDTDLGTLL